MGKAKAKAKGFPLLFPLSLHRPSATVTLAECFLSALRLRGSPN